MYWPYRADIDLSGRLSCHVVFPFRELSILGSRTCVILIHCGDDLECPSLENSAEEFAEN